MQSITSPKKRVLICIDTLNQYATEHRASILASLNKILQQLPGTRIFVTRRTRILPEIKGVFPAVTSPFLSTNRPYYRGALTTS